MTRKENLHNIKSKIILVLAIISLFCLSVFGFIACTETSETTDIDDPSITIEEASDSLIKNSSFSVGTETQDLDENPIITSISGWTKSDDNAGGRTSKVSSGVIDISEDGWNAVLKSLYNDTEFYDYMATKYNIVKTDVRSTIATQKSKETSEVTSDEIKEYIIDTYYKPNFANPSVHDESSLDKKVYILNNYLDSTMYGVGTASKLYTSSVSLEKDSFYKISVWAKTANIAGNNADGNIGANIRLVNTVGGNAQESVKISYINDSNWTNYVFYVKTDANQTCSITLNLGLGYGQNDYDLGKFFTEGTVFFDDIEFIKLDSEPATTGAKIIDLQYSSDEEINIVDSKTVLYNMVIIDPVDYTKAVSLSDVKGEATKTNIQLQQTNEPEFKTENNEFVATLNSTSATISIKDNSKFIVNSNSYKYISFSLKSNLEKLSSTLITVDVLDELGEKVSKRANVATISNDGEYVRYGLMIKNNFEDVDNREFTIQIIVGPTTLGDVVHSYDFATGTVSIKDITISSGSLDEDAENYDFYKLYSSSSLAGVALYTGSAEDYSEETSESTSYSLTTTPSNIGYIVSFPSDVKGYDGITANHIYLDAQNTVSDANTRSGKNGDGEGNYAGLINTNYLSNYTALTNLATSLNYTGEDAIQPLMIYNGTSNHYGFITNNSNTYTVSANNYAKVSLDVRVCDDAKAYIYLVNTKGEAKNVITFADFTVNTDVVNGVSKNTKINGSDLLLQFVVDSDTMQQAKDGWLTLTFYIATGDEELNFRLEMWNGGRDGANVTASKGYVFFNNVSITTANAFTEATSWSTAFSTSGNPLYTITRAKLNTIYAYQRELTETEIEFNKEYTDKAVSYETNYVWASNDTTIYAVYNTINPTEVDPYDSLEDDEDETANCSEVNSQTFWLSFSSILLVAVLILAIIALVIKYAIRKHKANMSDATSHYKVTSRIKTHDKNMKKLAKEEKAEESVNEETENTENEPIEEDSEKNVEETENEETTEEAEKTEESLDSYVYGDVQDFGKDTETNEEKTEETETPAEDKKDNE